jgi:hypothetical protein
MYIIDFNLHCLHKPSLKASLYDDEIINLHVDDFNGLNKTIKTNTDSNDSNNDRILTHLDVINRQRGYRTYLPDNVNQCVRYFKYVHNIDLLSLQSSSLGSNFNNDNILYFVNINTNDTYYHSVVPACLLVRSSEVNPSNLHP